MVRLPFSGSTWEAAGKHVLITGGSQGLGLAVALQLASEGADVTIVARTTSKLEKAATEIANARKSQEQVVSFYSADLSSFSEASAAVAWASSESSASENNTSTAAKSVGRVPDALFCCAGGANPGWFLEQGEDDFRKGFQTDYMTALASAHATAKQMATAGAAGKIVLVSSTVGLMGMVGYGQYSPMKFAIRGLAENLRSELLLYGISVHCYFPATILSPGYELENLTKPQLTKELEGPPEHGMTPEQCAKGLLRGVRRGDFFITTDFETELFRAATATGGSIPSNNWFLDRVKASIALIALPVWRHFVHDRTVKAYSKTHPAEVGRRESWTLPTDLRPTIFLLSLFHRLATLASLILLPLVLRCFDTSAELLALSPSSTTIRSATYGAPALASNLVRWDSIHFLGAASPSPLPHGSHGTGGYTYEQTLAFQPGLVWLLRLCGTTDSGGWSWPRAVALTSALAVLLSVMTPVMLYNIVRRCAPSRPSLAGSAALLSILSPSPATLVTPTPEPFFAFFALAGIHLLTPLRPRHQDGVSHIYFASACFALATAFRANGLLLLGYLAYASLWDRPLKSSFLFRLFVVLPTSASVAVAPFLLAQIWAWQRFCQPTSTFFQERPWCSVGLRSAYTFIQAEYWNVGFLRYWTLAQVPNFALALPVLLAASFGVWRYVMPAACAVARHILLGWKQVTPSVRHGNDDGTTFASAPSLLPHILLSAAYILLLLFQSHVQIALRFASPAWVGLWISVADSMPSRENSTVLKTVLPWLLAWNLISITLYAAFLPPA